MNPSPLPQPSAQTCPNCGAALPERINFCSQCGAPLSATAKNNSVWLVLGQIGLAFVALGSGLFGACFVLLGGVSLSSGAESLIILGIGAVGAIIAALCIRQIIKMGQRKK